MSDKQYQMLKNKWEYQHWYSTNIQQEQCCRLANTMD